jgi:WD40 repeat protein
VNAVAVDGDERYVLTGGIDATVRLWDLNTGRELWCSPKHPSAVQCVMFGLDGIAVGIRDGIWVWDMPKIK